VTSHSNAKSNRFLVTGGAGFIGHRTVSNLLAGSESATVLVVDNLSVGMPLPKDTARLSSSKADIRDRDEMMRLVNAFNPDTIIHLAAVHHIPTCEKERRYALEVNVLGTETMLDVAEHGGCRRFVLASSGAVYDWHDAALVEHTSALKPADNYSLAKHANELQVGFWAERTGGVARIARIFNTIGHDDPNAHLIPDIVSQIPIGAKRAEIALGNLTPRRDYIHADDTSRAIAAMAQQQAGPGVDVFNVSTGVDVSVGELVTLLGDVMNVEIAVREDPSRKRRVDRPSQLGATGKIKSALGFVPQKSLRIALEDIVRHSGRAVARSA
jgi:UDP-glucose 4-epimerase